MVPRSRRSEPDMTHTLDRFTIGGRCLLLGVAIILTALLVTAACLEPDPLGYGTHQQLGLPRCAFQLLVGVRCPSCGMTTSWTHLMQGRIAESFRANPAGSMLAILATLVTPWFCLSAVCGRWMIARPRLNVIALLTFVVVVVVMVNWVVRL